MIRQIQKWLKESSRIVVFTGAGISTESGISDYRSRGGLWEKFQPVTFQEFLADEDKRRKYWVIKRRLYEQMRGAEPNHGHLAIAELERRGKLLGVITQNIDGLHHKAGSKKILELHGTNREIRCLDCSDVQPFEPVYQRLLAGEDIPLCKKCGGLLKPATISFGQQLDDDVLMTAIQWAKSCDLMFSLGSSLVVEPAASIPRFAVEAGAKLVIVNRDPTPLDAYASAVLNSPIGETMMRVLGTPSKSAGFK